MATDDFESDSTDGAPITPGTPDGDSNYNLIQDIGDTNPGKHLLLFVPDFTNVQEATSQPTQQWAAYSSTPLNSYLRLGMADSRAGVSSNVDLGEDLAAMVQGFTDDTRNRGGSGHNEPVGSGAATAGQVNIAPGSAQAPLGYAAPPDPSGHDDTGPVPAGTYPMVLTNPSGQDYRSAESLRLHQKGGWRDHSDGNRITTTRGDKVEVIRGNYKLLVLGRQDDPTYAAGFDNSGGQIDTADLNYQPNNTLPSPQANAAAQAGLDMSWEWTMVDGQYRWVITTIQGAPPAGSSPYPNPTIINKTWAQSIDSTTNAAGVNTKVQVTGAINNTSTSASMTNIVASGNIFNETGAVLQESLLQAGVNFVSNTTGASAELDISGALLLAQVSLLNVTEQAALAIITDQHAVGAISTFQTAGGAIVSTQTAIGNVTQSLTGATILSNQTALVAMSNSVESVGTIATTITAPLIADTHAGIHLDTHVAGMYHIDNHEGIHFDMHAATGNHLTMDFGSVIAIKQNGMVSVNGGPDVQTYTAPQIKTLTGVTSLNSATTIHAALTELHL